MAAYRRVYDSRHLQADCQEPGGISSGTVRSAVEYWLAMRCSWQAYVAWLDERAAAAGHSVDLVDVLPTREPADPDAPDTDTASVLRGGGLRGIAPAPADGEVPATVAGAPADLRRWSSWSAERRDGLSLAQSRLLSEPLLLDDAS